MTSPQSPRRNAPYCPDHNPQEPFATSNPLSYSICMMRHCNNQYQILCPICKNSHSSHYNKLLEVVQLKQLAQNLIDKPFHRAKEYLLELITVMQGLEWINCFKYEMDNIQLEIRRQTLQLIDVTQTLISQYAHCKQAANSVLTKLQIFTDKKKDGSDCLSSKKIMDQDLEQLRYLQFNNIQNILDYGGGQIKHKENDRKNILSNIHKRIDDIKGYSLKIIQVILTSEIKEEIEVQQNDPNYEQKQIEYFIEKKKEYERLKEELRAYAKNYSHKRHIKIHQMGSDSGSTMAFGSEGSSRMPKCPNSQLTQNRHETNPRSNKYSAHFSPHQQKLREPTQRIQQEFSKQNTLISQKSAQQQIVKKCQMAIKEYQKKFLEIEERVKNAESKYQKKMADMQDQKVKLKRENDKVVKENKKMIKQFQQRLQIMKKYEKQLKELKTKSKIQQSRLVRTNSVRSNGATKRSQSKEQMPQN